MSEREREDGRARRRDDEAAAGTATRANAPMEAASTAMAPHDTEAQITAPKEPLPPPPTSAAMTLEQYRAYVASQSHTKGTVHATPPEEKAEQEDKKKHGWWPCQSYKCAGKQLNPKAVEKCEACGALRRLDSGGQAFTASTSAAQHRWNTEVRRR
jgi:hypothetical protein|tara:strand:- start:5039 stop:5506 length:468 start_codon:yes stop_codon:yes gene_type:complete